MLHVTSVMIYMAHYTWRSLWLTLLHCYCHQQAAVDATNVFYHLTYDGAVNIDSVSDPAMKAAILAQINHFGQTPRQLFPKPHPKRKWIPRPALALVPYSCHPVVPQVRLTSCLSCKSSRYPVVPATPFSEPLFHICRRFAQ